MASIKDVAQRAGVSIATVSRVMNNRGYIGKETRLRVEQAIKDMDYSPNQIARALQKSQSYFIGVIVPDSSHPFFADLIKFIEVFANEQNYKVLICNSMDDQEKEIKYISMLRQNRVDGIIMCSHTLNIEEYKKVNFPIVSFDRIISRSIPCVGADNFRGGELATEHLINQGSRRLLHLSGPLEMDMLANRRADAFRLTCMKKEASHHIIEASNNNMTFEYYSAFIAEQLPADMLQEYDGIFCSNDIAAYALYLHAIRLGISVPQQLRIVGYDYHNFTRMLQNPKLTTIKQPTDRIGKVLCSTLINMIEQVNEEMINNTIIDVELILGETT